MKSILRSTFYCGLLSVAIRLVSALLFGGDPISWELVLSSFIAGLLVGFIYVVAKRWTVKRDLDRIVIQFRDDEKILMEGFASHFKGTKGVPGKLVLTDKRLIFKSRILNIHIEPHQEALALEQVEKVSKTTMLKVIPNGLIIALRDNRTKKFFVEGAGEWVAVLGHQITRIAN